MGFIDQSRQRMRLARQRKQLESEPRPHALSELARAYLSFGDRSSAEEVAQFAGRLFPESEDVKRLCASLRGGDLDARLLQAKEAVSKRPSVASFLELADSYRALGRDDQYGITLREALERFQQDTTVLTQLAELRYRRYQDSFATPDGKAALDLYDRAIDADADNLKARFQSAELLYRIGANDRCKSQLEKLLAISPEHERAERLLELLTDDAPEDSCDLLSAFALVEERMEFVRDRLPWDVARIAAVRSSDSMFDPVAELETLASTSRARQVVYFDVDGVMHARRCESAFAESVRRVAEACCRAGRGMELGAPARFTIEAETGSIVLEMKRGASLGLLIDAAAQVESAAIAARDSLERMTRGA